MLLKNITIKSPFLHKYKRLTCIICIYVYPFSLSCLKAGGVGLELESEFEDQGWSRNLIAHMFIYKRCTCLSLNESNKNR